MAARDREQELINRCVLATKQDLLPATQQEANVFRVAAMVIQSKFPQASEKLFLSCNQYFLQHPDQQLTPVESINNGWIISLPRLRQNLSQQLEKH